MSFQVQTVEPKRNKHKLVITVNVNDGFVVELLL